MIHYPLRLVICGHINLDIRAFWDDLRQPSTNIEGNELLSLRPKN